MRAARRAVSTTHVGFRLEGKPATEFGRKLLRARPRRLATDAVGPRRRHRDLMRHEYARRLELWRWPAVRERTIRRSRRERWPCNYRTLPVGVEKIAARLGPAAGGPGAAKSGQAGA